VVSELFERLCTQIWWLLNNLSMHLRTNRMAWHGMTCHDMAWHDMTALFMWLLNYQTSCVHLSTELGTRLMWLSSSVCARMPHKSFKRFESNYCARVDFELEEVINFCDLSGSSVNFLRLGIFLSLVEFWTVCCKNPYFSCARISRPWRISKNNGHEWICYFLSVFLSSASKKCNN